LITGKIEQLKKDIKKIIRCFKEKLLGNCWKVLYFDKDYNLVDIDLYKKKEFTNNVVKLIAKSELKKKKNAVMFDIQKSYFKGCK